MNRTDYNVLKVIPTPEMQKIAAQILVLEQEYSRLGNEQAKRQLRDYVMRVRELAADQFHKDLTG